MISSGRLRSCLFGDREGSWLGAKPSQQNRGSPWVSSVPDAVCDHPGSFSRSGHCETVLLLLQALPGLSCGILPHTAEKNQLDCNLLLHLQQWGPFTALNNPNKTCCVISLGLTNKVEGVREGRAILLLLCWVRVAPAFHVSYGWGKHLYLSLT